jgi:hypothetical protein
VSLVGIYFIDRLAALFWKDPVEKKSTEEVKA